MALLTAPAAAQPATDRMEWPDGVREVAFDIPAQPLQGALEAFGVATGYSGLYGAASTDGRMSAPVRGTFTPDAALRMLLEHTGLAVHYTARDAFVLEPASPLTQPPQPQPQQQALPAPPSDDDFNGLLQARMRDVFCPDPRIAPGGYRVALRFRFDAQGRLVQPLLLDTSGDTVRDNAILGALRRIDVGRAPANPAQDFFMLILPRAAPWDCAARHE